MKTILTTFNFFIKSTNQHGVHSPFVFRFLVNGLYKKTSFFSPILHLFKKTKNTENIIYKKIVTYFRPEIVLEITNFLNKKKLANLPKKIDCIYFKNIPSKNKLLTSFNEYLPSIKNNSFWIFSNLYQQKEFLAAWQTIKDHPKVNVTIDLFYVQLIFFRKEQAKEHFKIRV